MRFVRLPQKLLWRDDHDRVGARAVRVLLNVDPWPEVDGRLDLERRLTRLDDATRGVVVDFIAGHTYAELAAAQHRPVGTVKAQIHRARLKLAA
jgi:DNA-directed RNA polymerase specialized sigma24 family protein